MKIVIAGGTGFLGQLLTDYFVRQRFEVLVLSRTKQSPDPNVRFVLWDGENLGDWANEIDGAEVLINLCGKSVDCRYTDKNKQLIYDTRLKSTRVLDDAINRCEHPPKLWINSSSATIYRHAEDREMDEETGEFGMGFSVDVCQKWEKTFFEINNPGVRKVALRIAIVLGKNGGALKPLMEMTRMGFGGRQGNGQQYFSWIHETDFINAIQFILENDHLAGVYNIAAANPVKNEQLMSVLRNVLKIPVGIPLSRWMLELGAWIIRTETELILKSRRVVPLRLSQHGFKFQYPTIKGALTHLLNK